MLFHPISILYNGV